MNIKDIISEEVDSMLTEIVPSERIPTFQYEKTNGSGTEYLVHLLVPEKEVNSKFIVSFSSSGNQEERGYSLSFKEKGGDYNTKTNFHVQFRLLATIKKIVTEFAAQHAPNSINFQPVKEQDATKGNRRLKLYLNYIQGGVGNDFDAFILGDNYAVSVEKKNPSFPIENGYQEPDVIQDIITQLSLHRGVYKTNVPQNDIDYMVFSMADYGDMRVVGNDVHKSTISCRRFVDWMFSEPNLRYVDRNEPEPEHQAYQSRSQSVDAPIQRVDPTAQHGAGEVGTFQHFMQNDVYGNPRYVELEPFYNTIKDFNGFIQLRENSERQMWNADGRERERLQAIVDAVDKLQQSYLQYNRANNVTETLNEIEKNLLDLI